MTGQERKINETPTDIHREKTINFDAFLGQANMNILFLTFSQKEHTSILILYENVFGTP